MLRSLASVWRVSGSRVAKPIYHRRQSLMTPLSLWSKTPSPCRSYCSEAKEKTLALGNDVEVIRDVPHKVMDADVDMQLNLAPTLPISMEPRKYIEFECVVCETTVKKTCSTHSYEKGVVLIQCPGCKKLHLIADHLGWTGFGPNSKTIEEIAKNLGKPIARTRE